MSARAGSSAARFRALSRRSCSSLPTAIRRRIGSCFEDEAGRSILSMNWRTVRSANCASTRGRSSLRIASLRRRDWAGSATRRRSGRGDCSSRPHRLSTSLQRNCARSPSTRTHAVYSSRCSPRSRRRKARVVSLWTSALIRAGSPAFWPSRTSRAKLKKRRSASPSSLGSRGMIIEQSLSSRAHRECLERLRREGKCPYGGKIDREAERSPENMAGSRLFGKSADEDDGSTTLRSGSRHPKPITRLDGRRSPGQPPIRSMGVVPQQRDPQMGAGGHRRPSFPGRIETNCG